MSRIGAAWIRPTSVEPFDLVDRKKQREELRLILEDYFETAWASPSAASCDARILVSGERGVGKSILTRAVLADFAAAHPTQVIPVIVDSRNVQFRSVVQTIALSLVAAVRPQAEAHRRELLPLLGHVELLATNSQVQRSQTEAVERKYGVSAGLSVEALTKLTSQFTWQETRQTSASLQATLTVTDNLLHTAISLLLGELAKARWFVVVFYDDLDQILAGTDADEILGLFRRVLDLRPCLALVHVRTECRIENLGREITETVEIKGVESECLIDILRRRLETAPQKTRSELDPEGSWGVITALSRLTANPLVFLRWVVGFLRTQDVQPAAGWATESALQSIVSTAAPVQVPDLGAATKAVAIIDRLGKRWFTQKDLLDSGTLSQQDLEDLEKTGLILPRYRFRAEGGEYYLEPVFNLLRPSLREKLTT